MEIADIFVINKADRKGVEETRRDIEQMLELSDLAHDAWRPPIIATVGNTGEGVTQLWDAIVEHRSIIETSGELQKRRDFRLREELREIVARRLELRAREICTGDQWETLQNGVLDRSIDPWSAADEMLKGVGA
jgi:LAO/AO transport system kinase